MCFCCGTSTTEFHRNSRKDTDASALCVGRAFLSKSSDRQNAEGFVNIFFALFDIDLDPYKLDTP